MPIKLPLSLMIMSLFFSGSHTQLPGELVTETPAKTPTTQITVDKPHDEVTFTFPVDHTYTATTATSPVNEKEATKNKFHGRPSSNGGSIGTSTSTTATTTTTTATPSSTGTITDNNITFIIDVDSGTTNVSHAVYGQLLHITWNSKGADYCIFSGDLFVSRYGTPLTRVSPRGDEMVFVGKSNNRGTISFADPMITYFRCASNAYPNGNDGSTRLVTHMYYPESGVIFQHNPDPRPNPTPVTWTNPGDPRPDPTSVTYTVTPPPPAPPVRPKADEVLGYISQWYGKFNEYKNVQGTWQTDPTFSHGAETSPLDYCKVMWPKTTVAELSGTVTIDHWIAADMLDYGANTKPLYICKG